MDGIVEENAQNSPVDPQNVVLYFAGINFNLSFYAAGEIRSCGSFTGPECVINQEGDFEGLDFLKGAQVNSSLDNVTINTPDPTNASSTPTRTGISLLHTSPTPRRPNLPFPHAHSAPSNVTVTL